MKTNWTKKYKLGTVDGESIYISAPSWDCGWYWGFGYLGNKNCHYHLGGIAKERQNLFDALKSHFDNDSHIFKNEGLTWRFCELVQTAYSLKKTAEVLGRGGSHYSSNPLAELIKNSAEVERINKIVLPAIFDEIEKTILSLMDFCDFLKSKDGHYVLTDGHYNLNLQIMNFEECQKYIEWQRQGGFDVSKFKIRKINKGEVFKTMLNNKDLIKLYDTETGESHVLLFNKIFTDDANNDFKEKILNYIKGV